MGPLDAVYLGLAALLGGAAMLLFIYIAARLISAAVYNSRNQFLCHRNRKEGNH